jgi:hypothetical protein
MIHEIAVRGVYLLKQALILFGINKGQVKGKHSTTSVLKFWGGFRGYSEPPSLNIFRYYIKACRIMQYLQKNIFSRQIHMILDKFFLSPPPPEKRQK